MLLLYDILITKMQAYPLQHLKLICPQLLWYVKHDNSEKWLTLVLC